jgi:hypothetical protein
VLTILIADSAQGEQFRTNNPLKAFVNQEYPWGDDYFIHGTRDTYLFRCILTRTTDGFDGIALSEISIWGNHGGPWEIFRKSEKGDYVYTGTEAIVNTACLERCQSKDYLSSGQCKWQRGGQNNSFTDAMGGFLACLGSVCHFSDNFLKRFHLRNSFHPKPLKIPIENSPAASCTVQLRQRLWIALAFGLF